MFELKRCVDITPGVLYNNQPVRSREQNQVLVSLGSLLFCLLVTNVTEHGH